MSNTWTWIIVGITVAIIAALAWYYMVKRKEENF
jgi:LPXTG-motif cell wall-anchored protein